MRRMRKPAGKMPERAGEVRQLGQEKGPKAHNSPAKSDFSIEKFTDRLIPRQDRQDRPDRQDR